MRMRKPTAEPVTVTSLFNIMADRDAPIVMADSTPVDAPETETPVAEKRRWPRWLVIALRVVGGIFLAIFLFVLFVFFAQTLLSWYGGLDEKSQSKY